MLNTSPFSNRVLGQFPLSIATSLAIEGAVGIHPETPTNQNVLKTYPVIWVNVKTLFRNIYNAIEKEAILSIDPEILTEGLMQEIHQLTDVIEHQTQNQTQVIYYLPDYVGLELMYPRAILRGDTTNLQKTYTGLMRISLSPIVKAYPQWFKLYKVKIKDVEPRKALMLTHYPLDLTNKTFKDFALLESHTGTIKSSHQWYTKYYNGKSLAMIPFREDLLTIFGDTEHFRPLSISLRNALIELATKYNWSSVTTKARIEYGLDQLKDRFLKDTILLHMRSIHS